MNEPVNPIYPVFYANCCRCGGRGQPSTSLATGEKPFTYVGWCCQDDATRERVTRAADEAFRALGPTQKHDARVRIYGILHTHQIERRERLGR